MRCNHCCHCILSILKAAFPPESGISVVTFQKAIGLELSEFLLEGRFGLGSGLSAGARRIFFIRRGSHLVIQFRQSPLEGRLAWDRDRRLRGSHSLMCGMREMNQYPCDEQRLWAASIAEIVMLPGLMDDGLVAHRHQTTSKKVDRGSYTGGRIPFKENF